jgi:hypothetical protein
MSATTKKVGFSFFEHKSDFGASEQASLANDIVFIQDTKEVFTHGIFFGMQSVTLNYNSTARTLQLKDGGAVLAEMDASPFVKDGMLDSVTLVTEDEQASPTTLPCLKFVFNTDSGKSDVTVPLSALTDVYNGANIFLTNAFSPMLTYVPPTAGDSMDVAIAKLLKGHGDQEQALENKQQVIVGAATTVTMNNLTPERVVVSSGSGKLAASSVTSTELQCISGCTDNIQEQIDGLQSFVDGITATEGSSPGEYTLIIPGVEMST